MTFFYEHEIICCLCCTVVGEGLPISPFQSLHIPSCFKIINILYKGRPSRYEGCVLFAWDETVDL